MTPSQSSRGRAVALRVVLAACLILVTIPRFDRSPAGPLAGMVGLAGEHPSDADQYVAYVEYFRGEGRLSVPLAPPFSYRPVAPLLASWLPVPPLTALNLVNEVFLVIGLWVLMQLLEQLRVSPKLIALGGALYAISFPVFYYGAIGYVDPVLLGLLLVGTYAALRNRWALFTTVVIVGVGVKEISVLLLPMAAAFVWASGLLSKRGRVLGLSVVAAVVTYAAIREFAPGDGQYLWIPTLDRLTENLARPRALASFILSFGAPGFLLVAVARHALPQSADPRRPAIIALWVGFATVLLLSGFAFLAAYADGRFIWLSYAFAIPLGMLGLQTRQELQVTQPNDRRSDV